MGTNDERTDHQERTGREIDSPSVPIQQGSRTWGDLPAVDPRTTADHADVEHALPRPLTYRRDREQRILERVERKRRRTATLRAERITLDHGSGGKATRELVEELFLEGFRNRWLERRDDGADLTIGSARLAFSTDSFVVTPLFFPGGDIGALAVNGTVNDLAVSGATPMYLSASFIIEEGFEVEQLRRIVDSMSTAAASAGVQIVTGDTKVVHKGSADGCYINTTGVGVRATAHELGVDAIRPGDEVLVTGPVGEHGVTVLRARGELEFDTDLVSDTAAVNGLVSGLLRATPGVRAMRDATRGGVVTVLDEIARSGGLGVVVDEQRVPVRTEVRGAAALLGVDCLHLACEGRVVVVVEAGQSDAALEALRSHPLGTESARIGRIAEGPAGQVLLNPSRGGTRVIEPLAEDPLPRVC